MALAGDDGERGEKDRKIRRPERKIMKKSLVVFIRAAEILGEFNHSCDLCTPTSCAVCSTGMMSDGRVMLFSFSLPNGK